MLISSDVHASVARHLPTGGDGSSSGSRPTPPPHGGSPAPRTIEEVRAANAAAGNTVDGRGDLGGTYTSSVRVPFGPVGNSDAARGQAALERTLADTAVSAQLQNDEFEVIRHDNGRYTIVLPGVIDLSSPHWGLDTHSRSVRDVDQFALPSSTNASVDSNRYAQMVREYVQQNIPHGADVMIVGHSYGADTAVDLAADPTFNNPVTGVNVTHVVAAAYFNQPQLSQVPANTQVLVLQNANDGAVIGEGIGYTATEVRNATGRVVGTARDTFGDLLGLGSSLAHGDAGGVLDHAGDLLGQARRTLSPGALPQPDAVALIGTGVRRLDAHTVVARFDGGSTGIGHHQSNYIDYINGAGQADATVRNFYASIAQAGYTAPGQTQAVDVSVADPNYRTTYPGDGAVERARGFWDSLPGSGFVEDAAGWAGGAAKTAWANRGLLGDARDAVRDGVVSTWNHLPGNDAAESFIGNLADALPFNNAASAGLQALAGSRSITLDADATQAVQRDPDFVRTEAAIVDRIKGLDGYGERPMDIPLSDLGVNLTVELGGQRGQGGMWEQLQNAWNLSDPEIRKTWNVAGNELTWLMRHARLDGTAHVGSDGSIKIDYRISDTLDLRPGEGRSSAYNAITSVTGAIWHDLLGAEAAAITGTFSRTVQ